MKTKKRKRKKESGRKKKECRPYVSWMLGAVKLMTGLPLILSEAIRFAQQPTDSHCLYHSQFIYFTRNGPPSLSLSPTPSLSYFRKRYRILFLKTEEGEGVWRRERMRGKENGEERKKSEWVREREEYEGESEWEKEKSKRNTGQLVEVCRWGFLNRKGAGHRWDAFCRSVIGWWKAHLCHNFILGDLTPK